MRLRSKACCDYCFGCPVSDNPLARNVSHAAQTPALVRSRDAVGDPLTRNAARDPPQLGGWHRFDGRPRTLKRETTLQVWCSCLETAIDESHERNAPSGHATQETSLQAPKFPISKDLDLHLTTLSHEMRLGQK